MKNMDCSLADKCPQQKHQQQLQQLQQQNQSLIQCGDDSIEILTKLAENTYPKYENSQLTDNSNCNQNITATSTITTSPSTTVKLRKYSERCLTTSDSKSHTYRISMANLEETQESELDIILGELSLLEAQMTCCDANYQHPVATATVPTTSSSIQDIDMGSLKNVMNNQGFNYIPPTRTHSRTNSSISACASESSNSVANSTCSSSSGISENGLSSSTGITSIMSGREPRTESPDNDSAFSDTVSLLSSESSASSSVSAHLNHRQQQQQQQQQQHHINKQHHNHQQQQQLQLDYMQHQHLNLNNSSSKAAKIQLALQKLEHASIRRLFVKAFTSDGASKSLLVDERMTCGLVTRLLADKNHVQMQLNWSLVESLSDLQMERLFEDHELLVDNLMTWNSDAGNRVLFQQRPDKISLFVKPEMYLPGTQMAPGCQHDEQTRAMLLEEFFESNSQIQVDGPLYMKVDSKKAWKRHNFVLRSSGMYYFPKEKTKNLRDLVCLTLFNGNNVYNGVGWKKKWKSPTDYTFGFKSAVDSTLGRNCRSIKMLCAEDMETMEKWITAIRISKYGKKLWDNYKNLLEDLNGTDTLSHRSFAVSMRSESITSISSAVPSQCGSVSSAISSLSNSSSGRASRASSSSSSGCLSDENNGFDSEFTTGTIKRKPSMKPNLPLTNMTRQLKEVGEIIIGDVVDGENNSRLGDLSSSPERSGTLTRHHGRRKSQESNGSGTLKRRPCNTMQRSPVGITTITSNAVSNTTKRISTSISSLDSLPPPPSPPPFVSDDTEEIYGSHLSLASLPPPPPPEDVMKLIPTNMIAIVPKQIPPAVPEKPCKSVVRMAPPYKAPPEYSKGITNSNNNVNLKVSTQSPATITTTTGQKKVSFADSPVLLRRKMCSPELRGATVLTIPQQSSSPILKITNGSNISSQDFGSPKRLHESTSNPPRDFLKDLQRVMRKKWQVAQKCKQEPTTMPHEVLGFRDFSTDELLMQNLQSNSSARVSSHYYRETANVSNWVQEHYGAGASPPPPLPHGGPLNDYALYENVQNNYTTTAAGVNGLPSNLNAVRKKRPPPPPPKRSDSTQLTQRT